MKIRGKAKALGLILAAMLLVPVFPAAAEETVGETVLGEGDTVSAEDILKDMMGENGFIAEEEPTEENEAPLDTEASPAAEKTVLGESPVVPGSLTLSNSGGPSTEAVISWHSSVSADEFRYLAGTHTKADFNIAEYAGNGTEGSVSVTENGNYTIFAKYGSSVVANTLTVTNIDKNSPDITLCSAVRNEDGTISIYYSVKDYYDGNVEVRIMEGSGGIGSFGSARAVSGSPITGIPAGEYTLFAKDSAGNISTYTLKASESSSSEEFHDKEVETDSWEWETEWHSSNVFSAPLSARARVRKVDARTGKDLPDAKLQLKDKETGLIKDEWLSNGSVHEIEDLIPGRTYVLHETCYPKGYKKAADIEFTPSAGETCEIEMMDEPQEDIPETTPPETTPQETTPPETSVQIVETDPRRRYEVETVPLETVPPETSPVEISPAEPSSPKQEKIGTIIGKPQVLGTSMERLPQTGGNDAVVALAVLAVLFGGTGAAAVKRFEKKEEGTGKEKDSSENEKQE